MLSAYLLNKPYMMWELRCHTDSTVLLNIPVFTVTEYSIWIPISGIGTDKPHALNLKHFT